LQNYKFVKQSFSKLTQFMLSVSRVHGNECLDDATGW